MAIFRALILGTLLASIGLCATISEAEVNGSSSNNTLATAQMIPGSAFTTPAPVGVFGTGLFAATVQAKGGGQDIDFYGFQGIGTIQLSITDSPFTFATILSLYDSTGHLLAYDDSSTPLKPGSVSTLDSYISYALPSLGTYYVAVSNAGASVPNYPDTSSCTDFVDLPRPDGGVGALKTVGCDTTSSNFAFPGAQPSANALSYNLVIAQTPEPGTLSLMLLSLGMAAVVWRKRTQQER